MLELAAARPPTLGAGRLVCLDGPAGSGKTTLAAAIVAADPRARVVHLDDLYDGWEGLPRVADQLETMLRPLSRGREGHYRRFDWDADEYDETVTVRPGPLLVVEGVGSGARSVSALATVLAWVTAPPQQRLERGLERDGTALQHRWLEWMVAEAELFEREGTATRADVLVDGTGATAPVLLRGPDGQRLTSTRS